MLLAVDVGNTNVTCGLFVGSDLVHTFRLGSLRDRTADEFAALLHQLLTLGGVSSSDVSAAVIASVVPSITDMIALAIDKTLVRDPLVVGALGVDSGLTILYDSPADVGADRIVNAVAAFARHPNGAMVVDFGTATTIDCVSPRGEYLGGVIVPGVDISLQALVARAAKLGSVRLVAPPSVLGRNTPHAMQAGIVYGYAALVDGLVLRLRKELEFDCEVLATGGLAHLIVPHTTTVVAIEPDLTLIGLRLLFERNRPNG
jgi:type III pantothenate kinase